MGVEHYAAVWEHSRQSGSSLLVLLAVASYSDHQGEWVIHQATLQKRARLGRRRVQQILAELVEAGELVVVPGDGRGHRSTYRLILGSEEPRKGEAERAFSTPKGEAHCTVSTPKGEAACTLSEEKGETPCTLYPEKGEADCALPPGKGAAECTLSAPPCPPFPPHPPIPLNPPEKQKQETFGLRPLTGPQGAVFRVNLLLEEAGVPLPSPAQIGLWSKTLGGIEPLLDLLDRLVQAGLANKREPIPYMHRVVMERAARPEPGKPLSTRAARELLWSAGSDEIRWQQALEIIANTEES